MTDGKIMFPHNRGNAVESTVVLLLGNIEDSREDG